MKKLTFLFLASILLVSGRCEEKSLSQISTQEIKAKIDEGFTHCRVTKEHSKDDCGFLLQNIESETLELFYPIDWDIPAEEEGNEVLIQYHPSRISQSECFNAQPIILDSVLRIQ